MHCTHTHAHTPSVSFAALFVVGIHAATAGSRRKRLRHLSRDFFRPITVVAVREEGNEQIKYAVREEASVA